MSRLVRDGIEVLVREIPQCDFCTKPAWADAKMISGPWAYLCEKHWERFGAGIGTGLGQILIKDEDNDS